MKKFGIALLGLLVIGAFALIAETVTTTNENGQVFLIRRMPLRDRDAAAFDYAAKYREIDVEQKARVGSGGLYLITDTGTTGYLTISDTNLTFTVTATNGVVLTVPKVNIIKASLLP